MQKVNEEKKQRMKRKDIDSGDVPIPPAKATSGPVREKMHNQVRKISMLSSGIKSLQAKIQLA